MPKCRICETHGEPEATYLSHNRTDHLKCQYHERYVKELRKKITRECDVGSDDDDLPAPDLREAFPTPTKRSGRPADAELMPPPRREKGTIESVAADKSVTLQSLITSMHQATMSQQDVREILDLRMLEETDEKEEKRIAKAIKIAKDWTPELHKPEPEADPDATDTGKELGDLQKRHGKRVGTLAASHKHVLLEMHKSKKSSVKEMLYDPDTNRPVLRATAHDDIEDFHILYLVFIDFFYIATHFEYLTTEEARSMHRWSVRRGFLGTPCVVVLRVVRRLLTLIDSDPNQDLSAVIKSEAKSILDEEMEFCPSAPSSGSAGLGPGKEVRSGSTNFSIKPGSHLLAVQHPRPGICWWWTNNVACEDLQNGKCKWLQSHGVCGKKYTDANAPSGYSYCKDKHRATECPK
jgi:hypothetical protein